MQFLIRGMRDMKHRPELIDGLKLASTLHKPYFDAATSDFTRIVMNSKYVLIMLISPWKNSNWGIWTSSQ